MSSLMVQLVKVRKPETPEQKQALLKGAEEIMRQWLDNGGVMGKHQALSKAAGDSMNATGFESVGPILKERKMADDIVQDWGATFVTNDEILQDLIDGLSAQDWIDLKDMRKEEIGLLHMTTGMHIRNKYDMWKRPYTPTDIRNGVDYSPEHPDNACGVILERLWEHVQNHVPSPSE